MTSLRLKHVTVDRHGGEFKLLRAVLARLKDMRENTGSRLTWVCASQATG